MREKCRPAGTGLASRLIGAAALALKEGDFASANRLHLQAAAADPSPRILWDWGRCLLFQGKHEEAARAWLRCWEQAKRTDSAGDRAQACAGLSRLFRELGDRDRASQFHQLSLAAAADIWQSAGYEPLPDLLRLNGLLQQQAEFLPRERAEQLRQFVDHCQDADLRGLALLSLADLMQESGERRETQKILVLSLEDFRQAGNLHGAMTALEHLAAVLLAVRRAEPARQVLMEAGKYALRVGLLSRFERFANLANRLKRALAVRDCTPLLN